MNRSHLLVIVRVVLISGLALIQALSAQQVPARSQALDRTKEILPRWAFVVNPPQQASETANASDETPRHVPESDLVFTAGQLTNFFAPPDWHPDDHPAMPEIVAHGRQPEVFACGYCHLPNGQGRPENASLAGLPSAYIVQQVADFKSGLRKSSEPGHLPTKYMIATAKAAVSEEVKSAAEYFAGLKPKNWIRVVETETVPPTRVSGWMLIPVEGGGSEAIGERIIETAENLERTELRDDRSGFVAYVPVGSIKKGEILATAGTAGKIVSCSTCHGAELKGMGNAPALAGRSPSYIVRQLWDMQKGNRAGAGAQKMKPTVATLKLADMLNLAAYAASLKP